jgi:hypothetical protein
MRILFGITTILNHALTLKFALFRFAENGQSVKGFKNSSRNAVIRQCQVTESGLAAGRDEVRLNYQAKTKTRLTPNRFVMFL